MSQGPETKPFCDMAGDDCCGWGDQTLPGWANGAAAKPRPDHGPWLIGGEGDHECWTRLAEPMGGGGSQAGAGASGSRARGSIGLVPSSARRTISSSE